MQDLIAPHSALPCTLGLVSPTKVTFLLSFSLCGVGGLKKGSDLTVNSSLTIAALQLGWELSPVIFYRNSQDYLFS